MKAKPEKSIESMSSVSLGGVLYEVSNEPLHGVIRYVKKMQKDVSVELIKKHRNIFTKETTVQEAMKIISEKDPIGFSEFNEDSEEYVTVATICLATNKKWTFDALDACSDKDVTAAFEKCKEVLGGDVTTFL